MSRAIMQSNGTIEIFQSDDGKIRLEVNLQEDTVWLTQADMVSLFERDVSVVSRHINNVFKEGEVDTKSNLQKMQNANSDKPINLYSLDVIISVGYRIKSHRGVQFRKWATTVLKEHLIKGYSVNTKRLIDQRLEFEIKESSQLVEKVLLMKGLDKDANSQDVIDTVSTYLGRTFDQETMILKAHILTERFMIQFLKQLGKNDVALDKGKLSYRHHLSVTRLFHKKDEKEWLWELLVKLNQIRNDFAHTLETDVMNKTVNEFQRICHLRLKSEGLEIKNSELKPLLVNLCSVVYSSLLFS